MCIRPAPALARTLVVFAAIVAFVGIGATNNPSITFAVAAVTAAAVERPRYYTRREAVEYPQPGLPDYGINPDKEMRSGSRPARCRKVVSTPPVFGRRLGCVG